ncbi:hypothetical protein ScPMuIL_010920 [Solemya velum]
MSWGTELWDQYDTIASHTQKGIDFCEKYSHFQRDRCTIELDYALKLKKLVKNYQPKKKEEDDYQYTWARGFADMLKEIHDMAGQHEVVAENTQSLVLKDLQQLIVDLKTERKKQLQEGAKIQDQLKTSVQQLEKSRRIYEKAFREGEKSHESYRKADADINLSRAEVEKHRNIMMMKNQQSDENKNEYASQLQQTNQFQRNFYTSLLPQVFQQLQEMDERRISRTQDYIKQCANIERNVIPIINTCIDGMHKAAESVDPKQDSQLVIEKYKSGFTIPEDIPFEDLSLSAPLDNHGNHASPKPVQIATVKTSTISSKGVKKRGGLFGIFGSSKVDDQKEDFSDFPPNQRRKKLLQKIDSIKKEIARETAEREGMLKMKDVYVQNPALGDPNTLDKKVEENAQKLDSLQQELRKFQNYLADAEGKQQRLSTSDDSISHSTSDGSVQSPGNNLQTSAPGTPTPQHNVYAPIAGDDDLQFADNDADPDVDAEFESFPVIGTCRALYSFDAGNEGSVPMEENEEMYVLEQDQGDGWTRVRKNNGDEGFVPTSYVQCHFYDQDEV